MRVVLVYDSYSRDRKPLLKVKRELERAGVSCFLIYLHDTLERSILYRPDAILLGNPDLYIGEYMTLLSNTLLVFSLPTEQGILLPEFLVERVVGGHNKNLINFEPPNLDVVNTFFLWGEYQRNTLQDAGLDPGKLFVSGNIRLDHIQNSSEARDNRCIGVALETEITKNLAYDLWALDGLKTAYGPYCDYYALDVHVLNAQMRVIKQLLQDGYRVIIRPRTADRNTDYAFLGDVEVDLTDSPSYLLTTCSFIITGQSTIGAEAYLYGAKVISVLNMVDRRIVTDVMWRYLTFQHPNAPSSVDELGGIINGSIPYKSTTNYEASLRYHFGIVDDKAVPEQLIAQQIIKKLSEGGLFVDQTNGAAARRINSKLQANFFGIKAIMVRNRNNYYGQSLAVLIVAIKALKKLFVSTNGN